MSDESNALLALKNAFSGVVNSADRVREVSASLTTLPETTPLAQIDLETYHNVALAQANAAMALRGVIEEIRRKSGKE